MDIKYHLKLVKQYDAFKHLSRNSKCVIKVIFFYLKKIKLQISLDIADLTDMARKALFIYVIN